MIEDLYIELLNSKSHPKIPPGVLGNYEVALLYLQRFGTFNLGLEKFPELNPDAFGVWAQDAESIRLSWDIPELICRIPEKVSGSLDLRYSQIQKLPKLEKVSGYLDLRLSQIQELLKLERVGGYLDLENSQIQEFPNLMEIGGNLYLENSQIQELPNLMEIGGCILAEREKLPYWKDYFNKTGRSHLAEKVQKCY